MHKQKKYFAMQVFRTKETTIKRETNMSNNKKITETPKQAIKALSNHALINTAGIIALSNSFSNGLIHVANCCMEYEERAEWELALKTLRTILLNSYHGMPTEMEEVDVEEVIRGLKNLAVIQTKLYEPEI